MNITIYQQIQSEAPISLRNFYSVNRSFTSNVIPHKGDFISDTAYKDTYEYEVVEVIIDYKEDRCSVTIAPYTIESNDKEHLRTQAEMFELHGWECKQLHY